MCVQMLSARILIATAQAHVELRLLVHELVLLQADSVGREPKTRWTRMRVRLVSPHVVFSRLLEGEHLGAPRAWKALNWATWLNRHNT